jgi:hypothetical protein
MTYFTTSLELFSFDSRMHEELRSKDAADSSSSGVTGVTISEFACRNRGKLRRISNQDNYLSGQDSK